MTPPLKSTVTAPESPRPAPTATPLLEISPQATERDDGTKGRQPAGSRSPSRSTAPGSAASDNRAAESATSDGGGLPSRPPLNLYQRLLAIQGEVDHIKATGKTPFAQNEKAISIEDVEDALGDLFQKHRVVTGISYNALPTQAGGEGRNALWLVDLNVWLVNPDDPVDRIEDRVCDVGTSPSAAVSFCIKRYYKALFHLAEEDDQSRAVGSSRPNTAKADAAAVEHLSADELMELDRLNKLCPAPVPEGLAWNSMLKGRDFPTLKGMLEKRYTMQTKDEA